MILSLIFWVIAAITYAGISVLLFRPTTNIFTRFKDQRFWSMAGSNTNPVYLPHSKYKVDSYHFAQTIMIICFALSAMLHHAFIGLWWGWNAAIELVAYCILWILPFNLFFNHLFIKKTIKMKNLLTGWRVVVVAIGFIAIVVGAIIALSAKVRHGSAELEAMGNGARNTGGTMVIIGVIICIGMVVYNWKNSKSEKNTELDPRYK